MNKVYYLHGNSNLHLSNVLTMYQKQKTDCLVNCDTDFIIEILISIVFFAIYIIFQSSVHTFDSIEYVVFAQKFPWIEQFHPHHLFYHQILYFTGKIKSFVYQGDYPFTWFVMPASLFGGLTVGAVWGFARLFSSRFMASLAALGTGCSYSMIFMSTEIEKYPIAIFFIVKTAHYLFKNQSDPKQQTAILTSVLLTAAVCIHQASLLFGVIPVIVFLFQSGFSRRTMKLIMLYAGILGSLICGMYIVVRVIVQKRLWDGLLSWPTLYIQSGSWGHGLTHSKLEWVFGHLGALFGLDLFLSVNAQGSLEHYQAELIFVGLYAAAWVVIISGILKSGKTHFRSVLICCLIWELSYSVFVIWWEPLNTKIAVLYAPAFWFLLVFSLDSLQEWKSGLRSLKLIPLIMVTVLLYINVPNMIVQHKPATNRDRITADQIASMTDKEDIILVPYNSVVDRYLFNFLNRPHVTTFRDVVNIINDKAELEQLIKDSIIDICKNKKTLYMTLFSCTPTGREPDGGLKLNDIETVMNPYLEYTQFITDLNNGDRLLKLDTKTICAELF